VRAGVRFVALVALGLGIAGCGVPTQNVAHATPDDQVPSGLLSPTPPTTTTLPPTTATTAITICLTSPIGPLRTVVRHVPANPTTTAVLAALAQDPTTQEKAVGLGTSVTSGIAANVQKGIAHVTLDPEFASNSSADQLTAVAQIVCTLTAQPGIGQLQFELGGAAAAVPRGDGSSTTDPVSRDNYPDLMPAKTLDADRVERNRVLEFSPEWHPPLGTKRLVNVRGDAQQGTFRILPPPTL